MCPHLCFRWHCLISCKDVMCMILMKMMKMVAVITVTAPRAPRGGGIIG